MNQVIPHQVPVPEQRQTAVTAYLRSKQLLLFAFARQHWMSEADVKLPQRLTMSRNIVTSTLSQRNAST